MNLPQLLKDPLFDKFWEKYPNKVGKIAAQKAWKKLAPNESDLETIINALERQKSSKMWKEGIGIPHPSTYLNQARFLDEPIEEKKKIQEIPWWTSDQLIMKKGSELGIHAKPGESMGEYKQRISIKIGDNK